jgi:nucleotide-binding universal stress UspA family protein
MPQKMKILIAYDGSSCADAALDDLRYAGLPRVAEALIMSVADVFLPPPPSQEAAVLTQVPVAVQQAWAQATRAVEEARSLAQRAQAQVVTSFPAWDVHAEACADSPAWAVIKQADTWQPDVVVVGSHGRSAMGRMLLGSVSQKVLTDARCSVRVGRRRRRSAGSGSARMADRQRSAPGRRAGCQNAHGSGPHASTGRVVEHRRRRR